MRVMSKDYIRDNKSLVVRKTEDKAIKNISSVQGINRYKSVKTLPSKSAVYGEPCAYRRILVSPNSITPFERR
jgi:hypothetical protein